MESGWQYVCVALQGILATLLVFGLGVGAGMLLETILQ